MEKKSIAKVVGAVVLAAAMTSVTSLRADQEVSFAYQMPMQVTLNVNETGCDNSPGPVITLDGEIALGGLQVQFIFQNNVKGTHRTTETMGPAALLVPAGGTLTIPKQPVLGGVGGNPWIYLQFFNAQGNLTPEILLGRCVQGLTVVKTLPEAAVVSTMVTASDCSNNPGPWITCEGDLTLSSLKARIIFKNNVKGTHRNVQTAVVELVPEGMSIVIPKQPVLGGVGGNPWIWAQYQDEGAVAIGDPYFLGRCSEM